MRFHATHTFVEEVFAASEEEARKQFRILASADDDCDPTLDDVGEIQSEIHAVARVPYDWLEVPLAMHDACDRADFGTLPEKRFVIPSGGRRWASNGYVAIDIGPAPIAQEPDPSNTEKIDNARAQRWPVVTRMGEPRDVGGGFVGKEQCFTSGFIIDCRYLAMVEELFGPTIAPVTWRAPSDAVEGAAQAYNAAGELVALVMGRRGE
jgi:hypothetical protein